MHGGVVDTVSEPRNETLQLESVFTVRKLKYGGYEVLMEGDREIPRRHICDFRSEYEARLWIRENAVLTARRLSQHH